MSKKKPRKVAPEVKARQIKYGLSVRHTRAFAAQFFDFDYLDSLNPDELVWMAQFCSEYYKNSFANYGFDFHPPQSVERKSRYDADNARRRDMWNLFVRVSLEEAFSEEDCNPIS